MEPQPLPVEVPIRHRDGTLRARLPTLFDVPALVDACQDPAIPRWTLVPSPYGRDEGRNFVEFSLASWGGRSGLHLIVDAPPEHPLGGLPIVGTAGFDVDWSQEEASIGYWTVAEARRQGVTSAVLAAMTAVLLGFGIQRIQASVVVGNEASGATLRKVGYRLEGVRRQVHGGGVGRDTRLDMEYYSLLPGELTWDGGGR